MSSNVEKLEALIAKVKKLIDQRDDLVKENTLLKEEVENLKLKVENINGNPNPDENGKKLGDESLNQLKKAIKQLDHYTKELDECIQWIENN